MKTFRHLTPTQQRAFEDIATMNNGGHAPKTLEALEKYGLIEKVGERVVLRDRFGTVKAPVYQVPIPVHIEWCQWCSENYKEEEA